jgi:putative ABC transport system substrate-binding protein
VRRRDFITLLGGAAAWPLAARAQQPAKIVRIGFLGATTAAAYATQLDGFRLGLRDLGYIEGKNIVIEFRWAEGKYERLQKFARDLIEHKVDVVVTHGTPGTLALQRVTKTVPIVMATSGDAVIMGLVETLARPGGNTTGLSYFGPKLAAKRLELIKEILPSLVQLAFLANPDNPIVKPDFQALEIAAMPLKIGVQKFEVRGPQEFESAFANMIKKDADAVVIDGDGMLTGNAKAIADIAAKQRLPAVGEAPFANAGGLIGYGPDYPAMFRRAASYVDKILKGTSPAELPVEQPTKFNLIINLKTAKVLGLTVPPTLVARADEVIE